jgi:hypothetical protein
MSKHLRLLTTVFALTLSQIMADELAFVEQETTTATIYNLQLRNEQGGRTIWSRQVELINGKKPYDWCSLSSWGQNGRGLLAIVYYNDFFGSLLQFDPVGKLTAEIEIGGKWINHKRRRENIRLDPPDKIVVSTNKGIISEAIIRDGKLYNPDGEPFVENQLIAKMAAQQMQTPNTADGLSSSTVNHPSPTAKATSNLAVHSTLPRNEPTSSTPWPVVVALLVAALGLLGLLLKKRK